MLAQRGDGKVLVTTFTSTLSETLQSGLDMLVDEAGFHRAGRNLFLFTP